MKSDSDLRPSNISDPNGRPDRSDCYAPIAIPSSEACPIQLDATPEAVTLGGFSISRRSSEVFMGENVGDQKRRARMLV
jgi:hypothetical protein